MEISCSFFRIVGGQCSQDKRGWAEKNALILPLLSCGKNISAHAQSVGVADVESEIELILARASMFTTPNDISKMTICPAHRSSLIFRHWVAERLSTMPRARSIIESWPWEITQG